jgi:hypothetical protein
MSFRRSSRWWKDMSSLSSRHSALQATFALWRKIDLQLQLRF